MALATSGTISANGASALGTFDAINFTSVTIQVEGTFVGTLSFQVSNNGITWYAKTLINAAGTTSSSITAPNLVTGDFGSRYIRVIATAWTSGTAEVIGIFSNQSQSYGLATQTVGGTVGVSSLTPGTAATNLGKAEDAAHASGDTGVAIWAVRNDNSATVLTSATSDYSPFAVDSTGAQFGRTKPALTAGAPTTVTPGTTNAQLIAANAGRRVGIIQNNSNVPVFIRYGATAATTVAGGYHMQLTAGSTYELPAGLSTAVQVIAGSAGTGPVTFTEIAD